MTELDAIKQRLAVHKKLVASEFEGSAVFLSHAAEDIERLVEVVDAARKRKSIKETDYDGDARDKTLALSEVEEELDATLRPLLAEVEET